MDNETESTRGGANLSIYGEGSATIQNNIFAYGVNGAGVAAIGAGSVEDCSYNDSFDNDGDAYAGLSCESSSNIEGDPLFSSRSTHDYHLQPGSACIDAGNPDNAFNDPDGSRNDIGAYGGQEGAR